MKSIKFFKFAAILLTCVFTMPATSCDNDDDNPKTSELKFDPAQAEVAPGQMVSVTVIEGTAPFTVESSDQEIATATAEQDIVTVNGIKEGTATIIVSDAKQLMGKIAVVVKTSDISELDFDKKAVDLEVGMEETVTIKNGTTPYSATTGNAEIATATINDDKITITGIKTGSTTVTVVDDDKKSGTISVTIK